MSLTIAIYAQGEMGASVARRLAERGVAVVTSLEGRSESSRKRAEAAGMKDVPWDGLKNADIFLSIVPPGAAVDVAIKAADLWRGSPASPLFVDCNAVSPATVQSMASIFGQAGLPFVDAGIIGGPPKAGALGPTIYVSGDGAVRVEILREYGLVVERIEGPVGAASSLKMSYAGITKGMTAIIATMVLAAERAGSGPALQRAFSSSLPELWAWGGRQSVGMIPKAYRWIDEMREIAAFQNDPIGADLFEAIARFYEHIAADAASAQADADRLRAFFG